MIETYSCDKKCCSIKVKPYKAGYFPFSGCRNYRKAGVFIYDPKEDRILLVQSRGLFWGLPKGTIEPYETSYNCAIREVKEETGLDIAIHDFSRVTKVKNKAIYYYTEKNRCPIDVQNSKDNDANGITWIKISCLEECVKAGKMNLNQQCRIVFKHFMNKNFPVYDFVTVEKKHKKKKIPVQ